MKEMMLQCPRCQWWNANSILKYNLEPSETIQTIAINPGARTLNDVDFTMWWRCYHCFLITRMKSAWLRWVDCYISKILTPKWRQEFLKFMEEYNDKENEKKGEGRTKGRLLTKEERSK